MVNLKIFLGCLGLFIPLTLLVACGNNSEPGRPAIVDYLKAYNRIDNDLTDTFNGVIDSIASCAPCQVQVGGGINQITVSFEAGQRELLALEVPDIPEVKALNESSKKIAALEIASLHDMQAGMDGDNQTAFARAYTDFQEANKQREEVRRAIESLMAKYKVTDAEVNYHFRSKP